MTPATTATPPPRGTNGRRGRRTRLVAAWETLAGHAYTVAGDCAAGQVPPIRLDAVRDAYAAAIAATERPPAVTGREREVLRGVAKGDTNAEIARGLFLAEDTVKTHVRRVMRKLSARSRAHAVSIALRTGLLT